MENYSWNHFRNVLRVKVLLWDWLRWQAIGWEYSHFFMPNTYFILFELTIYIQFALCLRHALKHDTSNIFKLFAGTLFGVLLELATTRQLNAYQYGQFLIMVLKIPLCIGVAWGCIIYAVMEFSDGTSLPYWTRPILDGLIALNIDLTMDTIAIRLGFWD